MKLEISQARRMLTDIFAQQTSDQSMVEWLTELSLDRDLSGNRFSGLSGSIEGSLAALNYSAKEVYEVDKPSLKLINGNGKSAKLLMKDLVPQAVKWTKQQGQMFIGFKNCGYHSNMDTIARKIAEQDVLCVYAANAGPQGVVPYGGSRSLFGTNPLAYGIPTSTLPIVFDAATAKYALGTIGIARKKGEQLEDKTYLDEGGNYTTDPNAAIALTAFGDYKGYAINLLLDVMTGAMMGGKSGMLQSSESELGGFLILVDPAVFGSLTDFKAQMDELVHDIETNPPAKGFKEVRVPGHRAQRLRSQQLESGYIEVDDAVYEEFLKIYQKKQL